MSTQHKLVVDLDKNSITLNGMYLGSNRNVEVQFDHTPWDGGSATITLHQVALTVEMRLVADSVTTILPLLPADGVREL